MKEIYVIKERTDSCIRFDARTPYIIKLYSDYEEAIRSFKKASDDLRRKYGKYGPCRIIEDSPKRKRVDSSYKARYGSDGFVLMETIPYVSFNTYVSKYDKGYMGYTFGCASWMDPKTIFAKDLETAISPFTKMANKHPEAPCHIRECDDGTLQFVSSGSVQRVFFGCIWIEF